MIKLKDLLPEDIRIDELIDVPPPQHIQEPPAIIQQVKSERTAEKDVAVIVACLVLEAGGEGEEGMHAVMNVIQNRAKQSKNPKDLADQVLKKWQFEAFNKYTVTHSENLNSIILRAHKHPKWNDAIKLTSKALRGGLSDITGGADHYYNPKTVKKIPNWKSAYGKTTTIGQHDFHSSKQKLTESISRDINEKIEYLESLLDASQKWHDHETDLDEGGEHIMRRVFAFEKKWNHPPLKHNEVEQVKSAIIELKRRKYKILISK